MHRKGVIVYLMVIFSFVICFASANALAAEKGSAACVEPAKGPIVPSQGVGQRALVQAATQVPAPLARVGKPAPDFEANAFHNGGFKNVKLSDYKGKWVVLCFYPGDFTFV
jgi:hypothetical protein